MSDCTSKNQLFVSWYCPFAQRAWLAFNYYKHAGLVDGDVSMSHNALNCDFQLMFGELNPTFGRYTQAKYMVKTRLIQNHFAPGEAAVPIWVEAAATLNAVDTNTDCAVDTADLSVDTTDAGEQLRSDDPESVPQRISDSAFLSFRFRGMPIPTDAATLRRKGQLNHFLCFGGFYRTLSRTTDHPTKSWGGKELPNPKYDPAALEELCNAVGGYEPAASVVPCPPIVRGYISQWLQWSESFSPLSEDSLFHGGDAPDWEDFALAPFFWRTVCTDIFRVKYSDAEYEQHIRGPLLADQTLRRWWEAIKETEWFQATLPADYDSSTDVSRNFLAAYTHTYCDDSGFESVCEMPDKGGGWSLAAIPSVDGHFVGSEFKEKWPALPKGYGDVKRAVGEDGDALLTWAGDSEGMILGASPMIRTTDLSLPAHKCVGLE